MPVNKKYTSIDSFMLLLAVQIRKASTDLHHLGITILVKD